MSSKFDGFQDAEALAENLSLGLWKKWMDEIEVYRTQSDQTKRSNGSFVLRYHRKYFACIFC